MRTAKTAKTTETASDTPHSAQREPGVRALAGWLGLWSLPTLALLDLLVAEKRGWTPPGFLLQVLGAAVVVGLLSALSPACRRVYAHLRMPLVLMTLAMLFGLGAAEWLAARFITAPDVSKFHLRPPGFHAVFRPSAEIMPGVEGEAHFRVNRDGVRGDELPGSSAYRILCLGGSTTECLYLDQPESWPELLGVDLRRRTEREVWVGNLGWSGLESSHHLAYLRDSSLARGMDCIVVLVGVNDLIFHLKGQVFDTERLNRETESLPWLGHTTLWRLARKANTRSAAPIEIEDRGGASYVARRVRRYLAERAPAPELEPSLAAYRERLTRTAELVLGRGQRCVLVTQPVLWSEANSEAELLMMWFGELAGGAYVEAPELRAAMDRYNDVLREVCAATGAELVELEPMSGNATWFYDDCHFNEAGAEEVARRMLPVVASAFADAPELKSDSPR